METTRFTAFQDRYEADGADPEQVVRLFVEALLAIEEDPALAEQLLCVVIAKNLLNGDSTTPSGHRLPHSDQTLARIGKNPAIARALAGGTPAAGYKDADLSRFALDRFYSTRAQGIDYPSDGKAKFFVGCSGADSPRPIALARNNAGRWKVTEWSSLTVGVRAAGAADDF